MSRLRHPIIGIRSLGLLACGAAALVLVGGVGTPLRAAERATQPAFQGHGSEMQLRTEAQEQRRRALFFEGVDHEFGEPGLPCDHLVKSKPQAIAGTGYVVLMSAQTDRNVRIRVWFPPGIAASLHAASAKAQAMVKSDLAASSIAIVDQESFMWCR